MHLLATQSANLDEIEEAIDLEQTPAEIVVLSFSDSDLSALAAAWKDRQALTTPTEEHGPRLRLANLKKLRHPMSVDLYVEQVASKARAIVVRGLGGLDYWRYGFEQLAATANRNSALFVALPGDDRPDPRLRRLSTAPSDVIERLDAYFRAGGKENLKNALCYISAKCGHPVTWREPASVPPIFGWTQKEGPIAISDVLARPHDDRPVALITFYRANVLAADTAPIAALMDSIEHHGLSACAIAVTSLKDPAVSNELKSALEHLKPTVIINATAFSARRDDETTALDVADVPVLQVALSSSSKEAWQTSNRGLSPSDLAMNVVLPELDGRIFTRAISFKAEAQPDPSIEHAPVYHEPANDRVDFVAQLASSWTRLAKTPPHQRQIALMLSDYPTRGGRTGYAVGLDTPASVHEILSLLKGEGYDTGASIPQPDRIMPVLAERVHEITIPLKSYKDALCDLPQTVQEDLHKTWGPPENDPALLSKAFHFPCIGCGNILILMQPDRGSTGDRRQSYHDTTIPPRHAYVALYRWLADAQKINALIHLGTHGTLEWLPGNALALSKTCFPESVLGPIPVIYPFIVNNPGEAVQAKRRLSAVTIGHMTPPLSTASLDDRLTDLETLIEEYAEADGIDRRRTALLESEILERAHQSGLAKDCEISNDDYPREAVAKLDAQLCDIKELAIRDSLHVFGRSPAADDNAVLANAFRATKPSLKDENVDALLQTSAAQERINLIAALDGRRVAPGPAGAPTRGRLDVLPTGRNLTTIDPRAIPTRTAAIVGARAADEVVRRYLQDHGEYPRALVLDLWASASLRTGGDDLAQALSYLGARPIWDHGSARVTGIEILPIAKLDRPRIDVTLRISGLFRDIFGSQLALFQTTIERIAALDEEDEWNPLAAARRASQNLSRIFGGAPGQYGAGAADLALDGTWDNREDLADAYLNASKYSFDHNDDHAQAPNAFRERITMADALVHPQDDRERDIMDGDGVADFVGGFSALAASLKKNPALYHIDTSKPDAPTARTMSEEITRIVRGRLANRKWLTSILEHGHRGAAEIAQGVDALYAFAATTHAVPNHLFDTVHDTIVADHEISHKILVANPDAAEAIALRLKDALERGLWTTRRNAVHIELDRLIEDKQTQIEAAQ